jgi:hypothetical protein
VGCGMLGVGFGGRGLGLGGVGVGCRVGVGVGCRVWGFGLGRQVAFSKFGDSRFRVELLISGVQLGLASRVSGSGCRGWCLGFKVLGIGLGFGFQGMIIQDLWANGFRIAKVQYLHANLPLSSDPVPAQTMFLGIEKQPRDFGPYFQVSQHMPRHQTISWKTRPDPGHYTINLRLKV